MNRKKFIEELAFLLQDIEDAEREEAMQYYECRRLACLSREHW